MTQFIHIDSIASCFKFLKAGAPDHPQIAIIRQWPDTKHDLTQLVFTSDLYYIAMKGDKEGAFRYGRNKYDFHQGTMIFMAPGQAVTFTGEPASEDDPGWAILFHPDLCSGHEQASTIRRYSFFDYELNEALHLSLNERSFINLVVEKIEQELQQNIDRHSGALISHHLETILKYCDRYYERQFHTRSRVNKDFMSKFDRFFAIAL